MGTKSAWTEERRARQAEIIRQTKPWEKSTGPRTEEGKAISSRNAYDGDVINEVRQRLKSLRKEALALYGRQRWPKMPTF
jgi:hypothetical protein